ncbi:protein-tyrosine phosphatase domain-containing protein [Ditylenchus destructor]|uniref:Protein-tyrosine phosphatase domain-containing protein n=1 Tax=Ditylenchus destructor TaxID=166010 RepID=A0AAD4R264_9BILA|nr:protein-tyrosine phosphatase domain-containing protein [Ditylenchus destructor]
MATVTPSLSPVLEEFSPEAKEFVRGYVHKVSHDGLHNLRLQYNDLRTFTPANFSHAASDANPTKCRYKDIICLDSSRVVLRWPPGATDDFVHANWVTHELFENKFICSQAPLDATVCDFWRVCWQEDVRQIIMLCRCEEMGKAKCAQYWPTEVDQEKTMPYGLTIKCLKLDQSDKNFIHTKLLVTCKFFASISLNMAIFS